MGKAGEGAGRLALISSAGAESLQLDLVGSLAREALARP